MCFKTGYNFIFLGGFSNMRLCCTVLVCTAVLYCCTLYRTVLYCTVPSFTSVLLRYPTCTVLHFTALPCGDCTVVRCGGRAVLHCTALDCVCVFRIKLICPPIFTQPCCTWSRIVRNDPTRSLIFRFTFLTLLTFYRILICTVFAFLTYDQPGALLSV